MAGDVLSRSRVQVTGRREVQIPKFTLGVEQEFEDTNLLAEFGYLTTMVEDVHGSDLQCLIKASGWCLQHRWGPSCFFQQCSGTVLELSTQFRNLFAELSCETMFAMTGEQPPPSLAELTERYRKASEDLEDARKALIEGIRAEYAAGTRQADIVRSIDHVWTPEYVRKIVKERV